MRRQIIDQTHRIVKRPTAERHRSCAEAERAAPGPHASLVTRALAPAAMSAATAPACPAAAARCRAAEPSPSCTSSAAPRAASVFTHSSQPPAAAPWSAVHPSCERGAERGASTQRLETEDDGRAATRDNLSISRYRCTPLAARLGVHLARRCHVCAGVQQGQQAGLAPALRSDQQGADAALRAGDRGSGATPQ